MSRTSPAFGAVAFLAVAVMLGLYFSFASIQGDYGLFRRLQVEAEAAALSRERGRLQAEVAAFENKTRRMSDDYLDLDLLDEQARSVLGLIRADEVVLP